MGKTQTGKGQRAWNDEPASYDALRFSIKAHGRQGVDLDRGKGNRGIGTVQNMARPLGGSTGAAGVFPEIGKEYYRGSVLGDYGAKVGVNMRFFPEIFNKITSGDARELITKIPDASIDLIFTDPVYERTEDYYWLGVVADRVLSDRGALLAWTPTEQLPAVMAALGDSLTYRWTFYWQRFGPITMSGPAGPSVIVPCVWYDIGGNSRTRKRIADWHGTANNGGKTQNHHWGKPEETTAKWIDAFNPRVVLDPFVGGGTVPAVCKKLGRDFIAFEIDPGTADMARRRLDETPYPLPIREPEQVELF